LHEFSHTWSTVTFHFTCLVRYL